MSDLSAFIAEWKDPAYIKDKQDLFYDLENYLLSPPKRILDIGCGNAYISEMFQKKYGTEIYLLDGDFSSNSKSAKRIAKYGSVEDFMFYSTVDDLKKEWDNKGLIYTFVDANNIKIPNDITFDLVYSWLSCGFHYPVSIYKDLIKKHTTEDSVIIMDFRRKSLDEQLKDFEIIHRLDRTEVQKKYRLHIKLKD
jgi:SAM-dependent methyltransferase